MYNLSIENTDTDSLVIQSQGGINISSGPTNDKNVVVDGNIKFNDLLYYQPEIITFNNSNNSEDVYISENKDVYCCSYR